MKVIAALFLVLCLFCAGCASDRKIGGMWHETTGLATRDTEHPCVHYKFVVGNLIWSIILIETIIAPVYFLGWSLYEPVGE